MTSRTKGVRKNKGTSLQANLEPKQIPGEGSQDANMQSTMASRIKGRRKATVNAFVQTQYIVNDSQINLEPIQIQSDANHPAEFSTTQDTGQSSASSCTNKKKARGESRNLKLLVDFPKGGVQVEFKNGKPVGDSAQYLITEMGVVLKNPYNAPLNVKCWDDIDDKKKDKIWMILKGKGLSNKDFFELTHRKKNGDWVDTSSRQIMENYEKKINDRQAEDASTDIDDNEIFTEIIGQKQRGHIRGKLRRAQEIQAMRAQIEAEVEAKWEAKMKEITDRQRDMETMMANILKHLDGTTSSQPVDNEMQSSTIYHST